MCRNTKSEKNRIEIYDAMMQIFFTKTVKNEVQNLKEKSCVKHGV